MLIFPWTSSNAHQARRGLATEALARRVAAAALSTWVKKLKQQAGGVADGYPGVLWEQALQL